MKDWQFFLLLSAAFSAPHFPFVFGVGMGIIYLLVAVWSAR